MSCLKKTLLKSVIAAALFSAQFSTYAAGMVPETSLLVIDEANAQRYDQRQKYGQLSGSVIYQCP